MPTAFHAADRPMNCAVTAPSIRCALRRERIHVNRWVLMKSAYAFRLCASKALSGTERCAAGCSTEGTPFSIFVARIGQLSPAGVGAAQTYT
jgi:hypothetical protein